MDLQETISEASGRVMYPSREALINSQMEYWYSLKEKTKPPTVNDYYPKFEGEIVSFKKLNPAK